MGNKIQIRRGVFADLPTLDTGELGLATDTGQVYIGNSENVLLGGTGSTHAAVTLDANADTLLSLSTQVVGLDTQAANRMLAGPTTGVAAVPTFRALVAADLPATYIESGLLTTRGDIIRRSASTPERYGLVVPSAPTINYLGVANGETDPTWKSASSNPGAAAAVLQSNASGVLQLQGLIAPYVRPIVDSPTALQLQNAAGTAIVTVDTSNQTVGIGIAPTTTNKVYVSGVLPAAHGIGGLMYVSGVRTANYQQTGFQLSLTDQVSSGTFSWDLAVFDNRMLHTGAGTSTTLIANRSRVGNNGGTITTGKAFEAEIPWSWSGSGTITTAVAYNYKYSIYSANTATVTTLIGLRGEALTATTGLAVTNAYHIYLYDVTVGSESNYAIYTNAGLNRFGDQLAVVGSADRAQLTVTGFTTQTASVATITRNDGNTNAIVNLLTLDGQSTGTAAAGFGQRLLLNLESSTTAAQSAAALDWVWSEATHASRKADLVLSAFDSGGAREGLRIRGTGSAAAIGLYGATPVTRATTGGSAATFAQNSGNAVNDASTFDGYTLNQVVLALRNIGVLT